MHPRRTTINLTCILALSGSLALLPLPQASADTRSTAPTQATPTDQGNASPTPTATAPADPASTTTTAGASTPTPATTASPTSATPTPAATGGSGSALDVTDLRPSSGTTPTTPLTLNWDYGGPPATSFLVSLVSSKGDQQNLMVPPSAPGTCTLAPDANANTFCTTLPKCLDPGMWVMMVAAISGTQHSKTSPHPLTCLVNTNEPCTCAVSWQDNPALQPLVTDATPTTPTTPEPGTGQVATAQGTIPASTTASAPQQVTTATPATPGTTGTSTTPATPAGSASGTPTEPPPPLSPDEIQSGHAPTLADLLKDFNANDAQYKATLATLDAQDQIIDKLPASDAAVAKMLHDNVEQERQNAFKQSTETWQVLDRAWKVAEAQATTPASTGTTSTPATGSTSTPSTMPSQGSVGSSSSPGSSGTGTAATGTPASTTPASTTRDRPRWGWDTCDHHALSHGDRHGDRRDHNGVPERHPGQ